MEAFQSDRVTIRAVRDGVRVGAPRTANLSVQAVVVSGATVYIDVDDLSAVPTAVIHDETKASSWVAFVFGTDVESAVARQFRNDPGGSEVAAAKAGPLAKPLTRMAIGLWLYRWWPLPDRTDVPVLSETDEVALEAELGVLAWFADELFDGQDVAASLLEDKLDFVDACAESALRTGVNRRRVLALVQATIDSVSGDEAAMTRLVNLEGLLAEADVPTAEADTAPVAARALASIADAFRGRPQLVAMGQTLSGTGSLEWGRIPPRTISSAEGTVEWSFSQREGYSTGDFSVSVPIHPDSRAVTDTYVAMVYFNADPAPEVVIELGALPAEDGSGQRLFGSAEIPKRALPAVPVSVNVQISSDQYLAASRIGTPVAASAGDRDRVASLLSHLVRDEATFARNVALPAYEVDSQAPWSVLRLATES